MMNGLHDALHAMGPQAGHIVELWRVFLGLCTAVFMALLATLLWALWRAPRGGLAQPPDLSMVHRAEPGSRLAVASAVAASVVGLLLLIAFSMFTDRAVARLPLKDAVTIDVVGHQWWWTVRYTGHEPTDTFDTANEIHVPVGRPVVVRLKSDDVIHSLWVPSLAGKKDLIPGRTAVMTFQADRAGVYEARCAEFCGWQHANMALMVQAHPAAEYEAWRQRQLQPASEPGEPLARRGKLVLESSSCALCHTVRGSQAQGRRGPDLTHVASRRTLAAGALPNTPAHLAAWIADPQRHKPGTNMPATPLSVEDLQALVTYLGTLQ